MGHGYAAPGPAQQVAQQPWHQSNAATSICNGSSGSITAACCLPMMPHPHLPRKPLLSVSHGHSKQQLPAGLAPVQLGC
jgi:hypothetical protein